jgi:hypothetical protein
VKSLEIVGDPSMNDVQSRSGIDRRTVVRAGVATAWTVPLVQAVGAAPAFAVSGPANLSAVASVTGSGVSRTVMFTIKNAGGSATTALNAVVSAKTSNVASVTLVSTDWSGTGPFTANTQLAGANATTTLQVTVAKSSNSADASVTFVFNPGGTGTAATVVVPLPK